MNIVITGASRGIGFAAAEVLLSDHQVLVLTRNTQALEPLRQRAEGRLRVLPFDLRAPNMTVLDKELDALGGQVDILINNAGLLINQRFKDLEEEDWQALFEVNFFGPVRLIRKLIPRLEQAEHPHILNISSMGGFQGSSKFPGLTGYSTSKAALAGLTECLAEEFKEKGISVNCLALGAVQTEMLEEAFPGMQAPVAPEAMGAFIAYFAEKGQAFFNGKILPVSVSTP